MCYIHYVVSVRNWPRMLDRRIIGRFISVCSDSIWFSGAMVHQGQRNCRERNNNSMNGSAVMQSNLSGCAFIVAKRMLSRFSFSLVLFFYRFNSLFLIFFFFSIHFRPTSSTDRTVFYDFDTQTSVIISFFFFPPLASPNNREPRYGIVRTDFCACVYVFFLNVSSGGG